MRVLAFPVCATLLAVASAPAMAEVAVIRDGTGRATAALEMRDRDLTPPRFWSPVRGIADPATILNPEGDLYMDGPPSLVMNPLTRLPEAVWSYWDGSHYQIAYSRFEGSSWRTVPTPLGPDFEFITSDAYQNLDPKLWIDGAGNRRVAWWRGGGIQADDVVISVLPAGETQWWLPQRVSRDGVTTRRTDIRTYLSYGSFIVAEEEYGGSLSLVIFDCPPLDGHTPQRGSDPWGRTLLRSVGPAATLAASLGAEGSGSGLVPVAFWREGNWLAVSVYDAEAGVWPPPVLTSYPLW